MRALPRPRTLVSLAGALLVAALLLDVFVYRTPSPPPPAAPPAPPVATSPVPPPVTTSPVPPPFRIEALRVSAASAYGATIEWTTPEPSSAGVRWGPTGMQPVLWEAARDPSLRHFEQLDGLAAGTSYTVAVEAGTEAGETASAELTFTTAPPPLAPAAAVEQGVVRVDGAAFFPLVVWQQCPDRWAPNVADGIDLFAGAQCVGLPSLLGGVAGKALAATTAEDGPEAGGPGVVGSFYPDEADARGLDGTTLPNTRPGLRFLTLSQHFYSQTAPLPAGRGMYPELIAKADVVGFDLYPLQELCRTDFLPGVFDAQQDLIGLAPGKPTFQWIEARELKCPQVPVTPQTVRAESWLALAGGARGLGFFPKDWDPSVADAIGGVTARIRQLEPALLGPVLAVQASPGTVRASARSRNGALYVLAVNAGLAGASVELHVPELGSRTVEILGSGRTLAAKDGVLDDALPPLGARVYVAPPERGD
jgi:hypothetical protein